MLNKLLIKLTKGRPRHSNDNLENGWATVISNQNIPSLLMNFTSDSFRSSSTFTFPVPFLLKVIDQKGKIKKRYRYQDYYIPYEKLRSIQEVQKYLKESITLEILDRIAKRYTDNEMARNVQIAGDRVFDKIVAA